MDVKKYKFRYARILDPGECLSTINGDCRFNWGDETVKNLAGASEWNRHGFYPNKGMLGTIVDVFENPVFRFTIYVLNIEDRFFVPMSEKGIEIIRDLGSLEPKCYHTASHLREMKEKLNALLPLKEQNYNSILEILNDPNPKRIHFATTHSNAFKPATLVSPGALKLPFLETIGSILSHWNDSQYYPFDSKYSSYWRNFRSVEESQRCKRFIEEYDQIVFLRDTLDLSIALSMNMQPDNSRTRIGELEYQAKYKFDISSENELVTLAHEWINKLPYYNSADAICAMPCSDPGIPSLPRRIVNRIKGFENISGIVSWGSKDKSLKALKSTEEKLTALEGFGLKICADLTGKNVILLDDLYMSGLSSQFVALKLKEAGADRVYGLSLVKSRSNTAL